MNMPLKDTTLESYSILEQKTIKEINGKKSNTLKEYYINFMN